MNKVFMSKWSHALGTWIACSEVTRRAGKVGVIVTLSTMAGSSFALTCTPDANGSYLPGNDAPSCDTVPATASQVTLAPAASWYVLTRSRLYGSLTIGDTDVKTVANGDFSGIGNQYANGNAGASINASNVKFDIKANGNVAGLSSHSAVNLTAKNVDMTIADNYTAGGNGSGTVGSYGVLAGSTVNAGEGNTYNGKYTTVQVDNLKINQTATGGKTNPILNNGIRAIQGAYNSTGNGSAGQVIVNNTLDMTLTGNRSIGIYVSGNNTNTGAATQTGANGSLTPKVILGGDSNIVINKGTDNSNVAWDSHAIKLGKVRYAGDGAGILESHGKLTIDTTKAKSGGGIKMMRNSLLQADYATSSTNLKTSGYALEIGGHDDGARSSGEFEQAASHGVSASFRDAVFTTTGTSANPLIAGAQPRKDLVFVDQGQVDTSISFSGANTNLTAHRDGYIVNVSGNYTAPNYLYYSNTYDNAGAEIMGQSAFSGSSVTFAATDAGSMTGLVTKGGIKTAEGQILDATKTPTLNLNLQNGFTWNMAQKATGDKVTSTFDKLTMTNGAVLNAFENTGTAAFVARGDVISNASTVSLQDTKPGDVLTISRDTKGAYGNYTGAAGKLSLDTVLADDSAATDRLVVSGNTAGSTEIDVLNAGGTGAVTGAGIKVVQVDGNSSATDFTLKNGAVYAQAPGAQKFEYKLYQGLNGGIPSWFTNLAAIDVNDWYLRSTCIDGSSTTGGSSTGSDALGCAPNDTIVVQDSATVNKVEGAGGADTISILGNASVTGDVLGGGQGKDNSAATDMGDTILVDTTGTIGGKIDGGLGNDTITVTGASTVTGSVEGGVGDDTIIWSGTSSVGSILGGLGSDTVTVSSTEYNGSQLLDGGDDTSVADGMIDTLNLNGVTATTNGSTITNWEVIKLNQGSKLTLDGTLATGAGQDAAGNPMGLAIDSSSTLATASTATVTGDVANAGTIDLHTASTTPTNSLTIDGNYVGNNGKVLMDTVLGNDSSATDSLHVKGNTSGTTNLSILNAGGTGAITTNGIQVVQVDGTSADGSFLLLNNTPLSINGFDYYLYKGLPDGTNNNWYLRSICTNGSSTTGGTSTGSDALGCAPNDTIVVQDSATVNKVEGAGGADTISILGNASVTGDVLGGGQGKDNSAATDMGDTILVDTTGTIGGKIDGGLGNDTITVTGASTVTGSVEGGVGDDTIIWSGTSSVGSILGGLGSDTVTVSSTEYNGSQLLDGGDDTSVADGMIDTLNLNGVTATTNGSTITNWEVIKLNQGSKLTLDGTLATGAGQDAAGNPMGLAIDSSSTLATASTATVTGDVANAGTIDLHTASTAPANALTINGNYSGIAGSKLLVDSTWNNANSLTTDTLIINGSASGSTAVSVPGGIFGDVTQAEQAKVSDKPVVTVSSAHSGTVFTGSAPTTNAGEAQLMKVGNNYHWTLLAKEKSTDPTPTVPIYAEPTSAYVQMPLVNKEMGFAQMGKLHERVGEQQTWAWDDCGTRCEQYQQFKDKDQKKYPVWGRINGEYLKMQGDNRFAFKSKTGFVQFGVDIDNQDNLQDGSRRHNGAMLTYGWGSTDFFDKNRAQNGFVVNDKFTGKADTDMLSLGGYSTWYARNGTYLDLVGNVSWLHNKYRSRDGIKASQNGYGLGLSAEVGRPWRIGESQWQIEPQAQLSYQYIHLNGFNDGVREVKGQSLNGVRGRIGARLAWNAQAEQLRTKTFYLTANVLHDFNGTQPSATLGREEVQESYGRTWGEVGLGAQTALGKATYLFGDVRYQHSLNGKKGALGGTQREGYHGRIGVRHTW